MTCISTFLPRYYFLKYQYHRLLIQSPTDIYLICFSHFSTEHYYKCKYLSTYFKL